MESCAPPVTNFLDGRNDVWIGPAAAEIAAHALANPRSIGGASLQEEANRGNNLPGRTIAALKGIVLQKGGLNRVELAPLGETLDRRHAVARSHGRQR